MRSCGRKRFDAFVGLAVLSSPSPTDATNVSAGPHQRASPEGIYGIIDVAERRMVYANAGHPPPLIVRANGEFEPLAVTGPALGFPRVAPMRECYAACAPGDGLVLFTDGVTDVGPSPDEFFEVAGIEATVGHLWARDVNQICYGLLDEVVRRAGRVLPDDATAVIVKFD
jgi:sigma-B regulation protein RsbU (phosphoserine phosphatase)